jgi:acyl carrier protein
MPRAEPVRSHSERLVAEIWSRLLRRDSLPVDEDFFTLGGTSLTALRVIAAIERETSVALPASLPFTNRTIRSLAAAVDAARGSAPVDSADGVDAPQPALRRSLHRNEAALMFMQRMFGEQHPVYHVPVVFEMTGTGDFGRLAAAVDAVVARRPALRSTVVEEAGDLG